MKDGSSLVVIPSSIPSSATHRPNMDLSSDEGPKEVLEDFKDELTMKKTVSDSNEEDSGEHKTKAIGMYLMPLLGFLPPPSIAVISHFFIYYNFLMQSLIILHVHSFKNRYS